MSKIKYQIIEFSEETAPGQKSVDIIPFDWISFDEEANCLITKFMPPPYNKETTGILHSLVRYCSPALNTWPKFPIKLRGQARNYKEATNKLRELNHKESIFTSDEEMSCSDRTFVAIQNYKKRNTQLETLDEEWRAPPILIEAEQSQEEIFKSQRCYISGSAQSPLINRKMPQELKGPSMDESMMNDEFFQIVRH